MIKGEDRVSLLCHQQQRPRRRTWPSQVKTDQVASYSMEGERETETEREQQEQAAAGRRGRRGGGGGRRRRNGGSSSCVTLFKTRSTRNHSYTTSMDV